MMLSTPRLYPGLTPGGKPTGKPTTFMMTTKSKGVLVAKLEEEWHFTTPLSAEQLRYVQALGLTEDAVLRRGRAILV